MVSGFPVPLDKLQHGGMVGVAMHYIATARVFGNGDEGDARPIAEEVDGLEEARIPIAATLVESDEASGLIEEIRMRFELVEDPRG